MSAPATHQSPVVLQRQQSTRHQHQRQSSTSSRHTHTSSRGGESAGAASREPHSTNGGRPSHSRPMPEGSQQGSGTSTSASNAAAQEDPRQVHTQRPKKSSITGVSGSWTLGKTIGAGSMGKVKLAKKLDGSEQVAVKIVPRHLIHERGIDPATGQPYPPRHDDSKEIRTAREAAIVTLLDHPYICGMQDVIKTNNHWYMLCEYVNGGQMLDYIISHGRLKEKQARKFGRQIASALDYCHRNSIVHRDLKIENILISKTGDIKIIDFGLSNLFSPRSHLKTFCGSLYFAAPELLQAKQYVGPEVDIWSFGIVLYVLVCGKVPFDDQNMPALHAKIKRGHVDYPTWISNECRLLLSRMLVTEPRNRASLHEIMNHPWMLKGYNAPPESHLPAREPLSLPLDPEVVKDMTGFEFGTAENITAQLTKVLESEEYQQAVHRAAREAPTVSLNPEKKKTFSLDFYKRRSSTSSKDTLTNPSVEVLAPYAQGDPINAYNPMVSVYYLVREKHERDKKSAQAALLHSEGDKIARLPTLKHPEAAHTGEMKFEVQGEPTSAGHRTRPRARTHGDDEVSESLKAVSLGGASLPPSPLVPTKDEPVARKDMSVGGMLRRLSTRRHNSTNPKPDSKHLPTPSLSLQAPDQKPISINAPRKSLSLRRAKEPPRPITKPNLSQPGNVELLTPPTSADGMAGNNSNKLGRSTSVTETDWRRKYTKHRAVGQPPGTSGSDRDPSFRADPPSESGHAVMAARAKSVGHHARKDATRRKKQGAANTSSNDEIVDDSIDAATSSRSGDARMLAVDYVKPVFLKGLFSVSTTSTKPPVEIRKDIMRVLDQLGVSFKEIKGGFSCVHRPSIDLKSVVDNGSPEPEPTNMVTTPSHRRKMSFAGNHARSSSKHTSRGHRGDTSPSNSDASNDSVHDGVLGGSLILQFEIYIVKVPLLALHGIQFKSVNKTNTWQYKSLASRILSELRL